MGARLVPTVVVKVGTSSITDEDGRVLEAPIAKLCSEVAGLRAGGARVVVVTSGAIAAGLQVLGLERPRSTDLLQAVSAVGQSRLMGHYERAFMERGLVAGQVLLAPLDFTERSQYLHARQTLSLLLELGVVPVVNENDAVADDEIRFGDNDRLAALVAHLVRADLLVLLTDAAGLFTADPRRDSEASFVEEVAEVDEVLVSATGPGSERGSGGMASKIAAWSGVQVVIASAQRPGVLQDAFDGRAGAGTYIRARRARLPARKLWIAFALAPSGRVVVDTGAKRALLPRGVSLLPAGVQALRGEFQAGDAVELAGPDEAVFAKGIVRHSSKELAGWAGWQSSQLPEDVPAEVVHRDDLVILP